jgi:hypothetical protein
LNDEGALRVNDEGHEDIPNHEEHEMHEAVRFHPSYCNSCFSFVLHD